MNTGKKKLIESLKADLINDPIESSAPIYQPIYFDEFKDIKTSLNQEEFYKKFNLIFKYIDEDLLDKKVLDIGSNAGFFSFATAKRGATVDAFEPQSRYFELCQKLCKIYNISNINFINKPISTELLDKKKYNYSFMLSVFQWISQGNRRSQFGKDILMETSKHIDTLFFELGCNLGRSAVKTRKINHLAYIYSLLRNNTIYRNIKLIGTTKIWGERSYRYLFICSNRNVNVKEPFYSFLKWIDI
ncbi:MAG: hypothetical protein E3J23_01385 [Candidatus Stahlbacteria bacterium]|nr:MAG: hypothetical protein E3J23_01385 [Candidatus Stahlbacteria bacterium]